MKYQLPQLPTVKTLRISLPAYQYNRARLALRRLESPLSVKLTTMPGLLFILEDEQWICVDRHINNRPLISWRNFNLNRRTGINQPVGCEVDYYHAYAGIILRKSLDALDEALITRPSEQQTGLKMGEIIPFPS
ncbi:hypothetical protein BOW53_08150 [Solemya pervernicosa gill symbiont]|uniref:Uncharacterized protein n=2 Tax=Gammaproteobacteria incertae sedis TaxID=118884 RepID=A0A1T2L5F0_9GAMM|nr:hypothetical protein [Candidatus Reidiella endopervernicosa]OOZ40335.1 hypothetical protein BOW53_08150 [Solemya pervernicosa gill symbiont]QKQ24860.1 hypothetical protein HUE57_00085 [Candidatus Reidiella endopervernicosa]